MSVVARIAESSSVEPRVIRSIVARWTACVAIGAVWSQGAWAIGLGPANVSSALGEPLRMSVPVSVQPDEEIGCIQVRPGSGDLPSVFNTRAQVIRSGGATRIEIRSAQPVSEPAIGVVVSVGCASPIARDYTLFLDPPVVTPTDEAPSAVAPAPLRRVHPMPTPVRRASASTTGSEASSAAPVRPRPPRPRPRIPRPDAAVVPDAAVAPRASSAPAPAAPVGSASGPDRLSVVPTESAAGSPATGGTAPAAAAAGSDAVAIAAANAAAEAASREDALRQQQAQLQAQLKSLSDQIAALRVQATTLAERNQALERQSTSPWWLIALAVVAILVAAWMAWRYLMLRRSVEGSAWWTANTVQPTGMTTSSEVESREMERELDPGTRMAARPAAKTDLRNTAAGVVSSVGAERGKPVVRPTGYPAAIDTDFTVSDIEAAMATVRTVSPPRSTAASPAHEDSDFAPLGGPTLPSPFSEPPPGAPGSAPPRAAPAATAAAQFVDFDIPPIKPLSGGAPRSPAPAPVPPKAGDFILETPDSFDPLASDSMKTTIFDGSSPAHDFQPGHTPTSLDFELPTATQIMALTNLDGTPPSEQGRHAGTLLDDLFETSNGPGVDTILDLDERHGAPLSMTEVDRLIATDADPETGEARPPRTRMAKFADLVNRVDEVAAAEPLRAIAQLRQFVLRDEQIPTLLWLRLFELYRQVDKKAVYNALAEHFARRYQRPMVAWGQSVADRVPQTPLSAHAELDREIESTWGTEQGRARLESLLCDRDQDDAIVFNAVLQHDLLDAAKIFPVAPPHPDEGSAAAKPAA